MLRFANVYGPRQLAEARGRRRRDLHGPAARRRRGDDLRRRRARRATSSTSATSSPRCSPRSGERAASSTSAPGTETSVNELFAATCRTVAGVEADARYAPAAPGDVRRSVLDVSRSERELGWRPQTSLAEGLATHVGLRPAATFVAIRVAFWLGAAATLIWAPAPERRLIGDAYGPASDFLFRPSRSGTRAGSSRSRCTATRRCRRRRRSSPSIRRSCTRSPG